MPQQPRRKAGASRRPQASKASEQQAPEAKQPKAAPTAKADQPKAKPTKTPERDPVPAPKPHAGKRAAKKASNAPKPEWPLIYLEILSQTRNKTKASRAARVNIKTVWERRMADPVFAKDEQTAMEISKDIIAAEITRRAMEGIKEIRRDGKSGVIIQVRTVYSDTLLLALARHAETGSWRDSSKLDITGGLEIATMTRAERIAKLAEAEAATKAPL